jgi:hypothetical protein
MLFRFRNLTLFWRPMQKIEPKAPGRAARKTVTQTEPDYVPSESPFWNRCDVALDEETKLAAHMQAENFAYRRVFGEMKDVARMGFPKALAKSVLLAVLRINPFETLSTYEAALLFGISQGTLSKRLAGETHYRGVNIGK